VKECYCEREKLKKPGCPRTYSGLSFLLLAVAVVLRTFKDRELHRLLTKDDKLRQALGFQAVPHRRTIEGRLCSLIAEAEAQIALLGEEIVEALPPSQQQPHISAIVQKSE
jgi:hypothetical protein